jgi:hypothetical protein
MRTTIAIDQDLALRVKDHANKLGNPSMTAMSELLLRKACDFIDAKGYDALIKIPSANKS